MMLAGEIVLLAGLVILAKVGLISRHEQLEGKVGLALGLVAHVIAIMLYLGVANEYRNIRLSRLVWLAFAVNSATRDWARDSRVVITSLSRLR